MFQSLRRVSAREAVSLRRDILDADTLARAAEIVEEVRRGGEEALRRFVSQYDGGLAGEPLTHTRDDLAAAWRAVPESTRELLERTAKRIRAFAEAQLACVRDLEFPIEGGVAGHKAAPVERVGCYIPGGRYPLVSSALMTIIPARVAGVKEVWAASPQPTVEVLAAAYIAGADALLAAGGAHAVAALAYGAGPIPACDVIVGPGNRWVTAAKRLVSSVAGIDMLAGPSELVELADASADAAVIAADLLAQAEHDPDALPVLVTPDESFARAVDAQLALQLSTLPTAETAAASLQKGFAVIAADLDEAISVCNRLAPEHLEVMTSSAEEVAGRLVNYGALFVGSGSAEALGDYGAGPNHVLPTGGTARFTGGLSVFTFLRFRTRLAVTNPDQAHSLIEDAQRLARIEGLEAHARSAAIRLKKGV